MKTKNIFQIAAGFAFASLLLAGCSKFLDKVPDNRTEIDNIDKVSKLLVTAYPMGSYASFLELRCDGMTDFEQDYAGGQPSEEFINLADWYAWKDFEQSPEYPDAIANFWASSYGAIASANYALKAIEQHGMTGRQADLAKAEARVARAYSHFMLLSIFSDIFSSDRNAKPGVPYVTEPSESVFAEFDRGTVAGTLEAIQKDLFDELPNIGKSTDYAQPKFHFTDLSARAFAVRLKLFLGEWEAAIGHANALIGVPAKFTENGTNTLDASPRVFVDPTDAVYKDMGARLTDWKTFPGGLDIDLTAQMFSSPAVPGNLLMAEQNTLIYRNFAGTYYSRYGYHNSFVNNMVSSNSTGTNYKLDILVLTGADAGFWFKFFEDFKYSNQAAGIGEPYAKVHLFRLEEVLLSRAEAYAMTGRYQEAINDMNLWLQNKIEDFDPAAHSLTKDKVYDFYKTRVDDPDYYFNVQNSARLQPLGQADKSGELQRAILLNLLDMRRAEYIFEGMRYFDVLRWNIPVYHVTASGVRTSLAPGDPRRIVQLPEASQLAGLPGNERHAVQATDNTRMTRHLKLLRDEYPDGLPLNPNYPLQ
jgi:hypothetical protein